MASFQGSRLEGITVLQSIKAHIGMVVSRPDSCLMNCLRSGCVEEGVDMQSVPMYLKVGKCEAVQSGDSNV